MMSTGAIIFPDRFRDPFMFEDILAQQDSILKEGESVDLSQLTFMEPYSMVSLLLLGRNYLRNRGKKLRIVNIPVTIHQYLSRMDFFKAGVFDEGDALPERYNLKRSTSSRRLIEVTEIPGKERESVRVISRVAGIFRKRAGLILKQWISDEVTDYFVTVISEVCQNIFEHSLDSGYLAMQTYTAAGEDVVRLVIADSGLGIPESLRSRVREGETHAHTIEMALTTPISSKREFGYGLCQVNTIVGRLHGNIFIRSQDASVTVLYKKKQDGTPHIFLKNNLPLFDGTQISISLSSGI